MLGACVLRGGLGKGGRLFAVGRGRSGEGEIFGEEGGVCGWEAVDAGAGGWGSTV